MNKQEMITRVKVLAGQNNLDEDEQKELEGLNSQLSAIKAKEDSAKLLLQAEEDAKAEQEAETNRKFRKPSRKNANAWTLRVVVSRWVVKPPIRPSIPTPGSMTTSTLPICP